MKQVISYSAQINSATRIPMTLFCNSTDHPAVLDQWHNSHGPWCKPSNRPPRLPSHVFVAGTQAPPARGPWCYLHRLHTR